MRRVVLALCLLSFACARPSASPPPPVGAPAPAPEPAPAPPAVPARGDGPPLPAEHRVLTRIAVGCCPEPGVNLPALAAVAASKPDLFVLIDRTAGEMAARADAYGRLNFNAQFAAFNMAAPTVAAPGIELDGVAGEGAFEAYWTGAALGAGREGVHGARIFGLPGRRVQLLVTSAMPDAAEQAWLRAELARTAQVRVLVGPSSLDVTAAGALVRVPTEHGPEVPGPGTLRPPPLSGGGAGFASIEIDWARAQVALITHDAVGRATGRALLTF